MTRPFTWFTIVGEDGERANKHRHRRRVGTDTLLGSPMGEAHFPLLLGAILRRPKESIVYLDFTRHHEHHRKLHRRTIVRLLRMIASGSLDRYLVIGGVHEDYEREIAYVLNHEHTPILLRTTTGEQRVLGPLDNAYAHHPPGRHQHAASVTARELQAASKEQIGQTGWIKRLTTLHTLGLVKRTKTGREYAYEPITMEKRHMGEDFLRRTERSYRRSLQRSVAQRLITPPLLQPPERHATTYPCRLLHPEQPHPSTTETLLLHRRDDRTIEIIDEHLIIGTVDGEPAQDLNEYLDNKTRTAQTSSPSKPSATTVRTSTSPSRKRTSKEHEHAAAHQRQRPVRTSTRVPRLLRPQRVRRTAHARSTRLLLPLLQQARDAARTSARAARTSWPSGATPAASPSPHHYSDRTTPPCQRTSPSSNTATSAAHRSRCHGRRSPRST